jgi:Domain of unknown function (DUF4268)
MSSSKQQIHLKYWQGFIEYMKRHYPRYEQRAPSKEPYQIVPPTWFNDQIRIAAGINRGEQNSMRVDLTLISKPKEAAKEWYRRLHADRAAIQREVDVRDGAKWEWNERPDDPESHIILRKHAPPEEKYWEEQYKWLAETVDRFHKAFGSRIDTLR